MNGNTTVVAIVTMVTLILLGAPTWVSFLVYVAIMATPWIRWRLQPTATLEVDNKTVVYRYEKKYMKVYDFSAFRGLDLNKVSTYFLITQAPDDQRPITVSLPVVQTETTTEEAKLTLEGETYDILMKVGYGQCPCGKEKPCWTGQVYVSDFLLHRNGYIIGGQVVFVEQNQGPKRKLPKFHWGKLKLPSINMFPGTVPGN